MGKDVDTKMDKYAEAAIKVAEQLKNEGSSYLMAESLWEKQMACYFPDSESSRKKGCPKHAFLGLCEHGLIVGVKGAGDDANNKNKNARYAIAAVNLLREGHQVKDKKTLWLAVRQRINNSAENENRQIAIVLGLYHKGLLNLVSRN